MTPERWQQIEALVQAAQGRTSEQREAQLAAVDPELRHEVEAMLAHEETVVSDSTLTLIGVGAQLGPYKLEAPIGKGGMGEVFRAMDTRLGRKVAIKISSVPFDARFEREARAISALNHPHICTLYDVGALPSGAGYLVMELVEGESLAARLKRGKLSIDDTLRYGAQIASALVAAHAKSITHRDLKPGNIMMAKSGVKVLDFGLSKSAQDATMTVANVAMGTPAYMAPEQREGRECDARTDIYALGLTLYEMLVGKRLVPDQVPRLESSPQLAHVIELCLAAEADDRWQSAVDIKAQLDWLARATATPEGAPRWRFWVVPGLALAVGALLVWLLRPATGIQKQTGIPTQFALSFDVDFGKLSGTEPQPSPDGRLLTYSGRGPSGVSNIWVRPIDSLEAKALAGTEGAQSLVWSLDGRWIGFLAESKVKKIAPSGGPPQTIAAVRGLFQEPAWGKGDILFRNRNREGLSRISELGGPVNVVTKLDESRRENSHRGQQFLPDGRRFLFTARSGDRSMNALYLGSLDTGKIKRLMPIDSIVRFIPQPGSGNGVIVYHRDGALVSQILDLTREEVQGDPQIVLDRVGYEQVGLVMDFRVSNDGRVAVYRPVSMDLTELVWYSRAGERLGVLGEPNYRVQIRLSPDGSRVAFSQPDRQTGNRDIFMMDLARGIPTRMTTDGGNDWYPVWSPDGKSLLFGSDRDGSTRVPSFLKPATGASAPESPFSTGDNPEDWSRDGKWIGGLNQGLPGLWVAEAKPGSKPSTVSASGDALQFSRDGRWIAYVSPESGQEEVYVRRLEGGSVAAEAIPISHGGGDFPVWNPAADELFFVGRDSTLFSVNASGFSGGTAPAAIQLFRLCQGSALQALPLGRTSYQHPYDTRDGKRFLVNCSVEPPNKFVALINWRFWGKGQP